MVKVNNMIDNNQEKKPASEAYIESAAAVLVPRV